MIMLVRHVTLLMIITGIKVCFQRIGLTLTDDESNSRCLIEVIMKGIILKIYNICDSWRTRIHKSPFK